jgi:hypothetical protein
MLTSSGGLIFRLEDIKGPTQTVLVSSLPQSSHSSSYIFQSEIMSSPQLTLYLAESGLNWLKLLALMEEVCVIYPARFTVYSQRVFSSVCLTS